MKSWHTEEYSFKITIVSASDDGNAQHCRNGHEPGDIYFCEYGCPMPMNNGGSFCSKSMSKLFPLLEAVRAGGDLSNLLPGAEKHKCEFTCPNGLVKFRLEAVLKKDFMPEPINKSTRQKVTDFITEHWHGTDMLIRGKIVDMTKVDGFVIFDEGVIIGLITYAVKNRVVEILSLDSLISNRGIGTMLLNSVTKMSKQNGNKRIQLVTTNDNINAIRFYQKRGFELIGINYGAINREREKKPQIPIIGENGIPLRHEIEFLMEL